MVKLDLSNGLLKRVSEEDWELPADAEKRLISDGNSREDAGILSGEKALLNYYDAVRSEGIESSQAAKWIIGEVLRLVKEKQKPIEHLGLDSARLAQLINCVENGTINAGTAKTLAARLCDDERNLDDIIKDEGLSQVSDEAELSQVVESVMD